MELPVGKFRGGAVRRWRRAQDADEGAAAVDLPPPSDASWLQGPREGGLRAVSPLGTGSPVRTSDPVRRYQGRRDALAAGFPAAAGITGL